MKNKKTADVLFRVYWNNSFGHDFYSKSKEHVCSQLLFSPHVLEAYPNRFQNENYLSQYIEGAAQSIKAAVAICKEYNLVLQISNEMLDGVGFPRFDVASLMRRMIGRVIEDCGDFENYFFEKIEQDVGLGFSQEDEGDCFLRIVKPNEIIKKHYYCRPLAFSYGDFGGSEYHQKDTYGGIINNYKWIKITDFLGEPWFDGKKTFADYFKNPVTRAYEIVEITGGKLPPSHTMSKQDL